MAGNDGVVKGSSSEAQYKRQEIVVALPHRDLVVEALAESGAKPTRVDESEDLGLALVSVLNATDSTNWLLAHTGYAHVQVPQSTGPDDLDPLLAALRGYFKGEYGGWTATFGKNRFLGPVFGGNGNVIHTGGGGPEKLPSDERPPTRSGDAGKGVVVGVLDTAVAPNPWLIGGCVADPADQLPEQGNYTAADGHATFVAGVILAQAPAATVRVRQVLPAGGKGADAWTVANEIVRLGQSGIDILNLSLICKTEDGAEPFILKAAVNKVPPDVVIIAAAGNYGQSKDPALTGPSYPAALPEVTAVGASVSDKTDGTLAEFTPMDAPWIDIVAPGTDIPSTYLKGHVIVGGKSTEFDGWARWSGTSFSAALASGAVAARMHPGNGAGNGNIPAVAALRGLMHDARRIQPNPLKSWTPRLLSVSTSGIGRPASAVPRTPPRRSLWNRLFG